ncbi:MAG: hypothetical protein H0T51_09920 [Pirellulales bacterium]|nr:hypothetical protein [Pirellulales bacterium]
MQALLAGITLALAGQLAEGTRYAEPPAAAQAAPAAADSQLTMAAETAAPEQADLAAGSNHSPAAAGQPELAAESPEAAASAAPAPLKLHQTPATTKPDAAAPQRSVLAAGPKPSDLMRELIKSPTASQLAGVPISLGEAVRDARSRQDQTARAKAYWNLSAATADYYLALLEHTELGVLRQSVTTPSKQWDVRQREAQARVEVTLRAAQGAQLQMHQLLGRAATGSLPLPGDVPHCGRYNAEYDEIFGARPDAIAKQLSELLPLRYTDLRAQAQAIADAAAWREEMSRLRDPAGDGLELLNSQDLLSLKRRAFIATARDYNQEIAAYTELAAPAEVAPDRLVAMMIRTAATTDDLSWQSSGVRQATAEERTAPDVAAQPPAGEARDVEVSSVPRTIAPESRREVRRPLQRLLDGDREHSILRRPIQRLRERLE